MRAVHVSKFGGPEVLEVRESADPVPGPGQARVRVHAAGVCFSDLAGRQGFHGRQAPVGHIPGYEAAGVIDMINGESGLRVGQRVLVATAFGGYADTLCVPYPQAVPMPDEMGFEEAAALPVNYLTAYRLLFQLAKLQPGSKVLVHMAAGGVGLAALQLCRTVSGVVTFGTASAAKHEILIAEGCAHPIDYRSRDYAKVVRELTAGTGVDVVLDPLGGGDWRKGYGLLADGGMLVAFGMANAIGGRRRNWLRVGWQLLRTPWFNPFSMMDRNRAVAGFNLGPFWDDMDRAGKELTWIFDQYRTGKIRPRIHRTFPFEHAADAHRCLHEHRNIGKVLLVS